MERWPRGGSVAGRVDWRRSGRRQPRGSFFGWKVRSEGLPWRRSSHWRAHHWWRRRRGGAQPVYAGGLMPRPSSRWEASRAWGCRRRERSWCWPSLSGWSLFRGGTNAAWVGVAPLEGGLIAFVGGALSLTLGALLAFGDITKDHRHRTALVGVALEEMEA